MKPGGKHISLLGSTGSIGRNVLEVVRSFPARFKVVGLAAGRNITLLAQQIKEFRPRAAAVFNQTLAQELAGLIGSSWRGELVWGDEGYQYVAGLEEAETVVSAMVGAAGLKPTWAAVQAGKRIALANKETLVMAGELVMAEVRRRGAELLPVDSEHSAIFQVLTGQRIEDVKRIILTASGGPFLDWTWARMAQATPGDALAHPNWTMGAKITIDSATLMNKGFEAIEARWLFGLPWEKIAIHIHPQSIVHSLVEFIDGSVIAQLGLPDMRLPIAYALAYPQRLPLDLPPLDLPQTSALTFTEPDLDHFPGLALALEAGWRGGTAPAVLNAANEVAVQAFLEGKLNFLEIAEVVERVLGEAGTEALSGLDQVLALDRAARAKTTEIIEGLKGTRR